VAGNHDGFKGGMPFWKTFWDANAGDVLAEARNAPGFPDSSYRFKYKGVNFSTIGFYGSWGLKTAEVDLSIATKGMEIKFQPE